MVLKKILTMGIFVMSCVGCDVIKTSDVEAGVRQSAMPLIVETVSGLNLSAEGNAKYVSAQLCTVLLTEGRYRTIRTSLTDNKSERETSSIDGAEEFINSGEVTEGQVVACAAYFSTYISTIPDVNSFVKFKEGSASEIASVDERAVIDLMPSRMAIARVNAEYFAKIAQEISVGPVRSIYDFKKDIVALFQRDAVGYLDRLRRYIGEENKKKFQLILLKKEAFVFRNDTGHLLDVSSKETNLFWHGSPWLSGGMLMGINHAIYTTEK
ncbi:hypothetical protein [Serratia liquefaciens]|uniref:hypothetical protein n=1 Tax=Serratia liquefaciens TaxID=614 RepID=UPI002177F5CD|nr:hypothetical protein [Serratia liquefaciens]CAI0931926.1 Uncharacterised protein [Serratia liquefaciens]